MLLRLIMAWIRALIVFWTLGALIGGAAWAEDEVFSIDAARRKIRADMQDWRDDRSEIESSMHFYCAWAVAQDSLILTSPWGPSTLILLKELPAHLGAVPELITRAQYTEAERERLLRLMSRAPQTRAGMLELFVDTELFLIDVSKRHYQVRLDDHLARAQVWLRRGSEMCVYYRVRTQQDVEFLRAGRRILEAYKQLEKELDHE